MQCLGHDVLGAPQSYCPSIVTLIARLVKAQNENRLERALKKLVYPKLLIIDEMKGEDYYGYGNLDYYEIHLPENWIKENL